MIQNLSTRSKKIIHTMLSETDFVSVSAIAKELGVSSRTILRELDQVNDWLLSKGAELDRKPGSGVRIKATLDQRSLLITSLVEAAEDVVYTPKERQANLLVELLVTSEPKKLYYFTSIFNVSEGTLSSDLDRIEPIVDKWGLRIIRKPGYGVEIQGAEKDIRRALSHLIFEHFTRSELLRIIRKKTHPGNVSQIRINVRNRLLNIIGDELLEGIEEVIQITEEFKRYPIADSSYVGLVVHLALSIQRLRNGDRIVFDTVLLEELKESKEYDIAKHIVDETSKQFNLIIPEDEIGYVTMHLKGSKLRSNIKDSNRIHIQDYEVVHMAKLLVNEVEQRSGYRLQSNRQLLAGLANHLGPALARIQMGMEIQNPLLKEIKSRYKGYYDLTEKSVRVIEEKIGLTLPEDEIGFIAMHLGAAIEERSKLYKRNFRVIIACSTGIGSSKLLEARLKKAYENLQIVETRSTIRLNEEVEGRKDVDLIIATVELSDSPKAFVVVSPLLLEEDIKKIDHAMMRLSQIDLFIAPEETRQLNLLGRLKALPEIIEGAQHLLESFFIKTYEAKDIAEIIQCVAKDLFNQEAKQEAVEEALNRREAIGTTYFDEKRGILLHCRTEAVDKPLMGFCYCQDPASGHDDRQEWSYVAVMIAPKTMSKAVRDLFGEISRNFIENEAWLKALRHKEKMRIEGILEYIIEKHIQHNLSNMEEKR